MTGYNQSPLYESPLWQTFNDGLRRPGGLELTDYAVSLCRLPSGAKVLDIGCGAGISVEYLNSRFGVDAAGLDSSEVMITEARRRFPDRRFIQADSSSIPVPDSCCSGVLAECSLSLCRDLPAVLAEVRRILSPGGYIIITDMYLKTGSAVLRDEAPLSCLKNLRSESKWSETLAESGFEKLLWEDRSGDLAVLAARIIFEFGTLGNFYSEWSSSGFSGRYGCCGKDTAKPGYFLCLARKNKENENGYY